MDFGDLWTLKTLEGHLKGTEALRHWRLLGT